MSSSKQFIRLAGWVGLLGAILVGIGEFTMQYSPNGGLEDVNTYAYFNEISVSRLSFGHFLTVLSVPLYFAGYWFLSKQLEPAGQRASLLFFMIGVYAFAVGGAWIGQRFFLAATVHEIASGQNISGLLLTFSKHNEPFVNVLRVAVLILSLIWIKLIISGKSHFPKWMALFSPILLLGMIFLLYFLDFKLGLLLFPAAMNVTHMILFALALWTTRQIKVGQSRV